MRKSSIFNARMPQTNTTLVSMATGRCPGSAPGSLVQPVRRGGIQTGGGLVLPVQEPQERRGAR